MTAGATEQARVDARAQRLSQRPTEEWQRTVRARQRVAALLHALPAGFVVFHDVELPKPSRAIVDHLVVGPRGVWSVTTEVFTESIAPGRGRNADTLWAGRTPLRALLEAADFESTAIAEMIGHPVEPLVCLVAPSLPEPAFDFHGIRICQPEALTKQVALSTADFVDVSVVADTVQQAFEADPSRDVAMPVLGEAVLPPQLRPSGPPRRQRTLGARIHAVRSHPAARWTTLAVLLGTVVLAFPTIASVWNSIASAGAARITDVIDEQDGPAAVDYTVTCSNTGWTIEWSWPGDLPDGVTGYGIRTQSDGMPAIVHAVVPWSDPTTPPPAARLTDPAATTVLTDHRAADGSTLATTSERIVVPPDSC